MPVYLKYDSIYDNVNFFNGTDTTVSQAVNEIYHKHINLGNVISWSKEDFPEILTRIVTIGYRDSDAYNDHINEVKLLVPESEAGVSGVTNTNYRLTTDI